MIYSDFQGLSLSLLGFGAMRLPLDGNGKIDEAAAKEMVQYAISRGVNYFDTAYPYHGGESERVMGRLLHAYPRDAYYLATKYPGHQISSRYDPAEVFEDQLRKCGVEYFDFYLLHNVYENSVKTYTDERWGIIPYFLEQKRLGRIRHLGFSSHGSVDMLKAFLDLHGHDMEFCQIQLNYLDWTLQNAKAKYDLLTERNMPVWVMEPVRGGRLAKLTDAETKALNASLPGQSAVKWAFRWLQGLPNVKMILSGMSTLSQMTENAETFSRRAPLADAENTLIMRLAEGMKNSIPCTGCGYCAQGCPMGLNIPMLLGLYNEIRFAPAVNVGMRAEALADEKRPSACVACGNCAKICPQKIDIPSALRDFSRALSELPSWAEICRKREETLKKQKT